MDIFKKENLWQIALINILPLLGFYFLGWTLGEIVLFYLLEISIRGIFNILRIIFTQTQLTPKISITSFFLLQFTFYLLIQSLFVCLIILVPEIFGKDASSAIIHFINSDGQFLWVLYNEYIHERSWFYIAVPIISIVQGFQFIKTYYTNPEARQKHPAHYLFPPYTHLFFHQILLMGGIWLLMNFPGLQLFLLLIILLKVGLEPRWASA
jgi:hypothetical protein